MIQLNTAFDAASPNAVRYYLVQHVPDLMRKESRNVGVVVQKGDYRAARFIGEKETDGQMDGRALRAFVDPRVYRMWVRHWRKEISSDQWQTRMFAGATNTFKLLEGGEVTDTGADTATDICSYLYSLLVGDGGLKQALGAVDEDDETAEITLDIRTELRKIGLMSSVADRSRVRNPVLEDFPVRGTTEWHHLTFAQRTNTTVYAVEPLNLATRLMKHARERAGYLSFIFSDLRAAIGPGVNNTAVVRVNEDLLDDELVDYCLKIVKNSADVVYWNSSHQREAFLHERERIALSL